MSDPGLRNDSQCADALKALGHAARLRILRGLLSGPRAVHELCSELDLEQHFVSRHLAVLRHADLVTTERRGQFVHYAVHPDVARQLDAEQGIDLGCCQLQFPDE